MDLSQVTTLIFKVMLAGFGAVGIVEYSKNFIKTTKNWIYSLIMPFISVGCYCATEFLPMAVIGSIITVGAVQLNYQIFVQGFKKIIDGYLNKVNPRITESETENKSLEEQ